MTRPRDAQRRSALVRRLAAAMVLALGLVARPAEALPGTSPTAGGAAVLALQPDAAELLHRTDAALYGWDLEAAERLLAEAGSSPRVDAKRGILYVYQARYEEAEAVLTGAIATGELGEGDVADEARHYLALARGAQVALGQATRVVSDDGTVEILFADRKDALLAPYLFDAMAVARDALGEVIGVRPDHPVRFEILDDPAKLAMVTPLTVDNIRTTGTVGVTKYRRVMMITPRVMVHGYGWLDTAVHEYVHYLLTIRTRNLAPVWLQEGLAKLLESRWRRDTPEPLASGVAYRLHRAIEGDDLVSFAEMYPSVAMLPSAERAALAYAEVETMLGLLHERKGSAGIAALLDAVADGEDAEHALALAWGDDFDAFMAAWKKVTLARTAKAREQEIDRIVFKDGEAERDAPEPLGDVFSHLGGGRVRQHARLGTLLQARGHDAAAAAQYEKAREADARAREDAALSRRLGRLYVKLERYADAVPLLDVAARNDPSNANLAAAEGRAALRSGDTARARAALARAVRLNPFIPTLHCDLARLADIDGNQARARFEAESCSE